MFGDRNIRDPSILEDYVCTRKAFSNAMTVGNYSARHWLDQAFHCSKNENYDLPKSTDNILQVDLEDYYVSTPRSSWKCYVPRVEQDCRRLLEIMRQYRAKATFFVLGYIAERHPQLIKEIREDGHEIGSHGYYHRDLHQIGPTQLNEEIVRSTKILQDLGISDVIGFRAPYFSISKSSLWAFDVLRHHFKYDSSIFPVQTPRYGCPNAPRFPYNPNVLNPLSNDPGSDFFEVPLSTYNVPLANIRVPVAGGYYLRLFPVSMLIHCFHTIRKVGQPVVFFLHPYDLESSQLRLTGTPWFYYWGLGSPERKLRAILSEFRFRSTREVLGL